MTHDLLIVGAGPAGATAARTLASAGVPVTMIDRARFPRNKPCGGAISRRVLTRFPWLAAALHRIPVHEVSRLRLEGPSGASILIESDAPAALMIRRVEFDHLLVQLAVEAGADLAEGVEIAQAEETGAYVELKARDGRTFRARHVVAADGVYSVIARRLGLNTGWPASDVALDMMEETPDETLRSVDPGTMWVSYGHGEGEGYAYVFPKSRHVNVGIGYVLEYYRAFVDSAPADLQQSLVDALRARRILDGASSPAHFTPYQLPIGGPLPRTATPRVVLAGDAGGFVNGITAEGIYYAMVSGELAARSLMDAGPAAYPSTWRREIGAELRDSVLVQRHVLTEPARVDRVIAAARREPDMADAFVRYTTGELTYREARRRLLRRAPLAAASLAALHARRTWSRWTAQV